MLEDAPEDREEGAHEETRDPGEMEAHALAPQVHVARKLSERQPRARERPGEDAERHEAKAEGNQDFRQVHRSTRMARCRAPSPFFSCSWLFAVARPSSSTSPSGSRRTFPCGP